MSWQSSVPSYVNHPPEPSSFSWDVLLPSPSTSNALSLDLGIDVEPRVVNPLQAESDSPQAQPPLYPTSTVDYEPLFLYSPNRYARPYRRRRPSSQAPSQNALMLETQYPPTPLISTISLPPLIPEPNTQTQAQVSVSVPALDRPNGDEPIGSRHVRFAEGVQSPTPRRRKRRPRSLLHKYLVVADRTTNRFQLSLVDWNAENPPQTARLRVKDFDTIPMTEAQRHELASSEGLTRMTLKSKDFRSDWSITLERSTGLACSDVFRAIHMFLQEPLSQEEFYSIPLRTLRPCVEAFAKRCRNANVPLTLGFQEGMKRVDYLGGKTLFSGLSLERESWIRRAKPEDCIYEIMFVYPVIPELLPSEFPDDPDKTDWPWMTPWIPTPEGTHLPLSELASYVVVEA